MTGPYLFDRPTTNDGAKQTEGSADKWVLLSSFRTGTRVQAPLKNEPVAEEARVARQGTYGWLATRRGVTSPGREPQQGADGMWCGAAGAIDRPSDR